MQKKYTPSTRGHKYVIGRQSRASGYGHDRGPAAAGGGSIRQDPYRFLVCAELFRQFMDNASFKRWMTDRVFELACEQAGAP